MRLFYFFVFIFCVSNNSISQSTSKGDSLTKILNKFSSDGTPDSIRVKTLCLLAKEIPPKFSDSTIIVLNQALKISEKIGYKKGLLQAYVQLANFYQAQTFRSIEYLQKAMALGEELKNYKDLVEISALIAFNYYQMSDFDMALKYSFQHAELCKKYGSEENYILALNTIAITYFEAKNYAKAEQYLKICEAKNKSLNSQKVLSAVLINLGKIYEKKKMYAQALENFTTSLTVNDGYGDKRSFVYHEISRIYLLQNRVNDALQYALMAYKASDSVYEYEYTAKTLDEIYTKLGKKDIAHLYLKKYLEVKFFQDSVKNAQIIRLSNVDYEIEKKNLTLEKIRIENEQQSKYNKILISFSIITTLGILVIAGLYFFLRKNKAKLELQKDKIEQLNAELEELNKSLEDKVELRTKELKEANIVLKQKNDEIVEALFKGQKLERKRVASQLHDSLGTTLMSINWLLESLDFSKLNAKESDLYQNIVSMTKGAYDEVRYLSHNLLPKEFEKIGLKASLMKLIGDINKSKKIIFELVLSGEIDEIPTNIAFNIYGVCMELTTNILKHSNATEAQLIITLFDETLNIKAIDNGVGIDSNRTKNGMGLENISERVYAISPLSKLEIDSNEGGVVSISVPFDKSLRELSQV